MAWSVVLSSLSRLFNIFTQYRRITLVTYKLEYISVVWNSITSTESNKMERIQHRSEARFNRFFSQVNHRYSLALEELKLYSLHMRRHLHHALFLIQLYFGSGVSEICVIFAPHVKVLSQQDAHHLLMFFARTLTYFEPKRFP